MKVHAAVVRALTDHGLDKLFGVLGDANLYMVERFVRDEGGTYIDAAHEAGAVLMAYGYANRSQGLGVATVGVGPAVTNTVTALVEAARGRTPLLLICGDTPAADRYHLQNINQRDVIIASGAGFEQVTSPHTVVGDISIAIQRAMRERRPIVLNIPVEYMWDEVEYQPVVARNVLSQKVRPDPAALDRAVGIVASARRPIVLAGRGVTDEAQPMLLSLADRIGAPIATTLRAQALFANEPFNLGIFGTLSTRVAVDAILASDCVIAFGASLNPWTTASGSLLKGKALVHCDLDGSGIGLHVPADAAVVGDAGASAEAMVELLVMAEVEPSGFRSAALGQALQRHSPADEFDDVSTDQTVDIRSALYRLNSILPKMRTVTTDGGRFIEQAFRFIDVPHPRAFVYAAAFGSIGLGMATAIGAAYAAPNEPVVLIAGDGGFMNGGITEFNSAVRNKVDVITLVCNDGAYGAEFIQFRNKGIDPSMSLFDWPDFAHLADSLGGRGVTVRNLADLDIAATAIRDRDRPLLIDLKLDPDRIPELQRP